AIAGPQGSRRSWPDATTPAGLVPGMVGTAILVMSAAAGKPAWPIATAVLGGCIGARAVLAEWERRRAQRRFDAAFEIGVRLADLHASGSTRVREGMEDVCAAVAEALRADAAAIWQRETDGLALIAIGPERFGVPRGLRAGSTARG